MQKSDRLCRAYARSLGKAVRTPRKPAEIIAVATRPVERIRIDVVGPISTQTIFKAKYFVTALDEHTGNAIVRFVHEKSETAFRSLIWCTSWRTHSATRRR